MNIQSDITKLIGNTPIIRLNRLPTAGSATVLVKLEYFNPGGSVKDRIALAMIEDAEAKGLLKKGGIIVEPTSGNTGIGLAMVSAAKGYKCVLTMPETMSVERQKILKLLGAEIVLTPGAEGMTGAVKRAEELNKNTPGSFMPQQFKNQANPAIHRKTTAREILDATGGKLDVFVAGIGTGGTITGVGEVLKGFNKEIKIYGVEPSKSPVLSGGKPGPHKIQGIGAGFVPDVLNRGAIDEIIQVNDEDAIDVLRKMAKEEGLFVGISSGAAVWAALEVAAKIGKDKTVLALLPDTGERYLSMLTV
ncbi:MAG: cysteine synthase A [Candidatus Omnitrophica bacterium]|nr:cysteine synthase A [Candidatus Omnitrophota bacterium]